MGSVSSSVPETTSNFPDDLRLPDPRKDLRRLSKELKRADAKVSIEAW